MSSKPPIVSVIIPSLLAVALWGVPFRALGQVPGISSLTPMQGKPGDTVHLAGTNFSPVAASNIVYFGAMRAVISNASVTGLDVIVPAAAAYAPLSVTVAGLIGQSRGSFLPTFDPLGVGFGAGSYAPFVSLPVVSPQLGFALGDLNGDGKPDLVTANSPGSTISAYQNNSSTGVISTASFSPPVNVTTGNGPYHCLVVDLDGDGKLDIVTANNGGFGSANTVSVLRNIATDGSLTNGSFAARVDFEVAPGPTRLAVGDLDGDGRLDIAAITATLSGGVSVLRNTGSVGVIDTNSFATFVHFPTGPNSREVRIDDLDGDGQLDLLTSSYDSGTVSLLRNTGSVGSITTNSFAPKVDFNVGTTYGVITGDLDGDGKPEIVATKFTEAAVAVFKNISTPGTLGSNSFAAPVSFLTGAGPTQLAIGDLDGDGKPDLVVAPGDTSVISVLRNIGTNAVISSNSFAARVDFASGASPSTVAVQDLDGDGRPELVASCWGVSSVSILKSLVGPIPPAFTQQPTNVTAVAGTSVSLVSAATGSAPLAYQWFRNDAPLAGATNATLTFPNVSWSQAGVYKVAATNLFGSATSSNAQLTIYAHHFDWASVPSPQAPLVPFAVAITAKDALNQTITNFSGSVAIFAMATNTPGTNLNFEAGSLTPWTPLNLGNQPGPYDLVPFDVNGDTNSSTALRIAANSGTPDGIMQNIPLLGGVSYTVRVDVATDNLTSGNNLDGGTSAIAIGSTTVRQFSWGPVNVGRIYRTNLTGTFTPPTNGVYPVKLTFQRAYLEAGNLWCFADDLVLRGYGPALAVSPSSVVDFTNGIWSGPLTVMDAGANITLRADDGFGHIGSSNPFNITNPLAPAIFVQPAGQNAVGGDTVSFTVSANGALPFGYVWRKNGTNIAGATGGSLTLSNVTRFSSAAYSVIVTNVYGSTTSSNAQLMVRIPQRLTTPTLAGTTLTLTSGDVDGGALTAGDLARFSVQASTNLVNWSNLPVTLILNNGGFRFTDSVVTNRPVRFYRVVEN